MPVRNSLTAKMLEAATQLFARKGYHATTTREIARLADVSENTLFRHFKNKEDIFCSALRAYVTALRVRLNLLKELKPGDSLGVALPKILAHLAEAADHKPEIIRLIAVAFVELHEKTEAICRDLLSPLFSEISQYLAAGVEKGEVVDVDPSLLAGSLMSMVLVQPQLSRLIGVAKEAGHETEDAVNLYCRFWLVVLSPGSSRSPTRTSQADNAVRRD
jgi:AcrR family transcriptional regulator